MNQIGSEDSIAQASDTISLDKQVEDKWIKTWQEKKIFEADPDSNRQKVLVTVPFPYMNGPLHVGHALTDGRADVYARFKRMQGVNTLFPWAWHWTGQPLVAAADRLSKGDPSMVKEFLELEHVSKVDLPKFYDPVYMANYYTDEGRESLKRLGLSIDWRREFHTTDLEPSFNKFVLWQMNKLREKGYITRGTHPVVWCPHDQSPTGDHDRLEGEGVTWEEFVLVLFPSEGDRNLKFVAATLRPETIFAATNLWVNPNSQYVEAIVDEKDHWIISSRAAMKLAEQLKKIEIVKRIQGRELIDKKVILPLHSRRALLVLPGNFVDEDNGTGVVYSVPAHAPADYVALRDIKNDLELQREFGLSMAEMDKIQPIPLISISGMGELPAVEITERMRIKDQFDPKVTLATAEIYKKEFHQGILNSNAGTYSGMRVSEAKPIITKNLKELGVADSMYELPEKVICRCTTECIVKILEDQWFLKYSDPEWKRLAHECINKASIYPENARQWFHDVIDWFRDWPCARRVGLGTPLPWSPGWIVETLSDSTIYMAFYTISSTMRKYDIQPENLTDALFSYVLLGEGTLQTVAKETKLESDLIEEMRYQFQYWYPVNLRNSAKELIPNHLTFFVFQHVAFFPEEMWPTAISANGMLTREGAKMSKSKGNLVTLRQALDEFGADVVRAAVLGGSDGLDDVDWREKNVRDLELKISSLSSFILSLREFQGPSQRGSREEDLWLESQIQLRILSVIQDLTQMKTKSAFQAAFYSFWNDVRHYLKRTDKPSQLILNNAIETWVRLLSPFIPYTCEELNSKMGSSQIVSISKFPEPDTSKINTLSLLTEAIIQRLIEDAQSITKLFEKKPSKLYLFIAPSWTYELLNSAIEPRQRKVKLNEILEGLFSRFPDIPKKDVANLWPRIVKILNELGDNFIDSYSKITSGIDEERIYGDAISYLEREIGAKIVLQNALDSEKYDPREKAKFALPFKPALYFE
jgi:leucyl-tRNA synthetase